jgi:hypothetical protein
VNCSGVTALRQCGERREEQSEKRKNCATLERHEKVS